MREKKKERIEVHVSGMCFDNGKVLVAKRSSTRSLFPEKWETGGGQANARETFEQALTRQLREELGIIVELLNIIATYSITPHENDVQAVIPGLRFTCKIKKYVNGNEPTLTEEHTEWRWQPIDQLDELDFIPGVKEAILQAYKEQTQ